MKNPYLNALLAASYIAVIVSAMGSVSETLQNKPDNVFMPMTMLSLFVLSVATMAVLFFFTPVKLLLENQKEEALKFFLKTLGTFAVCVALFVVLMFML